MWGLALRSAFVVIVSCQCFNESSILLFDPVLLVTSLPVGSQLYMTEALDVCYNLEALGVLWLGAYPRQSIGGPSPFPHLLVFLSL